VAGVPDDDLIHTSWGPSFASHRSAQWMNRNVCCWQILLQKSLAEIVER
jgi:hypothetical protein